MKATIINMTERRVIAESISATYALSTINDLWEILEQFEGKKVTKVDGSLTKKFKDAISPFMPKEKLNNNGYAVKAIPHHVGIHNSFSSLIWKCGNYTSFGTSYFFNGESSGTDGAYYDYDLYIAKTSKDNLLVLGDKASLIAKLTKDRGLSFSKDIAPIQAELKELKEAMSKLELTIPYYARKGY